MDIAFSKAVDRLEAVLTAETGALASGAPIDLGEIAARKNQSLLEFSRLSRRMPPREKDDEPAFGDRLKRLAGLLEENRRTLELHVTASHQVSEMISRSLADADSDGTYSAQLGRPAAAR
ncbi:flagellar protein FlgN [Aurantimonas sp. A2-1-M11]|uniref:flagellar protein FlgN n=1 Tax=Aurantimonas sp. A2-1-M11 TaxID=3113712 RepID=UPI002F955DC5